MVGRVALRELSRVAFDPGFPDFQLQVYQNLILLAFELDGAKEPLRIDGIVSILKEALGLESVPVLLVGSALETLEAEGTLSRDGSDWRLTPTARPLASASPLDTIHKAFKGKLRIRFGDVDRHQEQVALESLDDVLVNIVEHLGKEAVAVLSGKTLEAIHAVDVPSIVSTRFYSFPSGYVERLPELSAAVASSVVDVFEKPEKEWLEALGTVVHRAVMCFVLTAGPEYAELAQRLFRKTRLFLDTNVVFALVCKGSIEHEETRWIVEAARTLGVELLVQDSSLLEFERTLTKDTLRFQAQRGSYIDPDFYSRDLARTYYKHTSEFGDWHGFVASIRATVSRLDATYGIRVLDATDVDWNPRMIRTAGEMIQEAVSQDKTKDERAIDHDARSLVLIHGLRRDFEAVGVGVPWLLTRDYSLIRADQKFSRKLRTPLPGVVGYDLISQLMAPFLKAESTGNFAKILGKLAASKITSLTFEDTLRFASYTLDQLGVRAEEDILVAVASEAHASRVLQAFSSGDYARGFRDLKLSVERALATGKAVADKEATITRLVSLIKATSPGKLVATQTQSSGITNLVSSIKEKLRITISTEECPAKEEFVQWSLNAMLRVLDYNLSWEGESVPFSTKKGIPDFVVSLRNVEVPIEVKLVGNKPRLPEVIEEMAADFTIYRKKYQTVVFVVYDCGFINDVEKFSADFENQGAMVLVIKH